MFSTFLNNIYNVFSNTSADYNNTIANNNAEVTSFQLKQGNEYLQNKSRRIKTNSQCGNYKYNWKGDIIEGNSGMIGDTKTETANTELLKEGEKFIDKYNQDISKYALKQKFLMDKTNIYLSNVKNPYKNKNVKLSDGQMGYVTAKGVFKWFPNQTIYDQTAGKNGCPSGIINLGVSSNNNFNTRNEIIYTDYPLVVGTQMKPGQSCGNEGENVFVSQSTKNENVPKTYAGCYNRSNTGLDFQSDMENNVSIDSCKMRAIDNGSVGFAVSNKKCYTISDLNSAYSRGVATKSNTSYTLVQSLPTGTYSSSNSGGLLFDGTIGIGNSTNFSSSSNNAAKSSEYVSKTLFSSNPIYSGCKPNSGALIDSSDTIASYGTNCTN
jgi:hypothetical protein